jgi:hypothetical protein
MAALREDIADLRERLAETEALSVDLPHRRKYLQLTFAFLEGWLDLHERLVDDVERELAPEP